MISILVPTSGRPEMFLNMLRTLRITTATWNLEVIAVIDADPLAYKYAVEYDVNVVDYSPKRRGALWAWNRALRLSDGDIIVPAGDDQVFYDGWLEFAMESHIRQLGGYGVVGMNDLAYDGNTQLATMWIFDRKYCKEQMGGIFAPPCYHYFCVDSEWNAKAKELGRFYWDERAVVEHLHSAHGKRPVDTTDGFKEDSWMEADNKTFEDRKTRCFPIEWEPLI